MFHLVVYQSAYFRPAQYYIVTADFLIVILVEIPCFGILRRLVCYMPNFVHNFAYRNLFPYFVNNNTVW